MEFKYKEAKLIRRCDKMSKLEFVAIQFGVKFFVIHNLRHYVDKVCHFFIYFQGHIILFLI